MNSWQIEMSELPSRGMEYPVDTKIKIHPLTVGNCKYLCTLNPQDPVKATKMLNEVLESCIETDLSFGDLVWADRNYLLFWIRVNSFISSNGYNLEIQCPYCGEAINKQLKLDNLEIKYADQCEFVNMPIEIGGEIVNICSNIPLVKEEKIRTDDLIIEDILNYTNIREYIPKNADLTWWISQLDVLTFVKLKSIAEKSKYGIEGVIKINCDSCGKQIPIDIDISDTNMFGRLSLYEILKVQIQVSKYCGFQVSDDTCYTDVEITQEVIKALIEEEKAEMEKQKSNNSMSFRKPNINMSNFRR